MTKEQDGKLNVPLRYAFVAMLFSLAIAEIARQFAQLVQINGSYLPAYAHLLLVSFVVVSSCNFDRRNTIFYCIAFSLVEKVSLT